MPDFYSGATNHLGCFIEGFSLRRVQLVLISAMNNLGSRLKAPFNDIANNLAP